MVSRMAGIDTLAWFDGEIRNLQEIRVSPLAHALHYGTGAFEGIRCYRQASGRGGVFRLREHMERLSTSCRILGVSIPYDTVTLCEATLETLRANSFDAAYIRPLVFMGEGAMGVAGGDNPIHTLIAVWQWGSYLGDDGMKHGIKTLITSYERTTGNAAPIRGKLTGQYIQSFMAKRQVRALGIDEGLLIDRDGYLSEATGENLFVVVDGTIFTAPDSSPILHGITRDTVLTIAADLKIPVRLERFGRSELYRADEAFLSGTAAEITPVRAVDDRTLRVSPGPVTKAIQSTYLELVRGNGPRATEWITEV
ncbi:MAG: branched-chain amino acid transaminase [Planctomycetes bacterium]|nr:branched-chain amino acid transaminase [Planctomycetota bacterium]